MANLEPDLTFPSVEDVQLALEAFRIVSSQQADGQSLRLQISTMDGAMTSSDLPQAAMAPLTAVLKAVGEGKAVAVRVTGPEISMQQATDLLHVSSSYLVGLINNGTLRARIVNDERRLQLRDVLVLRRDTRMSRRATLDELAQSDQELGLR